MRELELVMLGIILTATGANAVAAEPFDLSKYRLLDLTHPFDAQTLYWPSAPSAFELKSLHYGDTGAGFFYAANSLCTPEHGGTHLDAPIHFAQGRRTVGAIPLEHLVAAAVVIDVSSQAARDPDYRLAPADVVDFERRHGRISAGSLVLLRTGWERRWPDRKAYFGDDTPGDAAHLHFPSFGPDAVQLLLDRGVVGIGVDTASIDHGPAQDFPVHRLVAARDVPGFENLTGLAALPARGSLVIALPMKIGAGSGAPLRVIALVPK